MPAEFLTDDEAAYGRCAGAPSQADLERVFFLDDDDWALVDRRRGEHMKVGFALQLVTVRWLGTFLEDPLDVPVAVLDFAAGQLGLADPSWVKRNTERAKTRFDHQWEIRRACGLSWGSPDRGSVVRPPGRQNHPGQDDAVPGAAGNDK